MEKNKKIFAIIGKSNTGKSTIFKELMKMIKENNDDISLLKCCTTRPKREEDNQNNEYDFVDKKYFFDLHNADELLEYAVYNTVYGNWFYFTRKSDLKDDNYIKIINPSGLAQLRDSSKAMGYDVISFKIVADDEIRMNRALSRNDNLSLEEINRRFDADEKDFKSVRTDLKIENNGEHTPYEVAELIYKYIKKNISLDIK